jgi:GT2 family glycosyltransferase
VENDTMKKIGIIIPSFNRKEYLRTLLLMLGKQQTEGFGFFVIVSNDGSNDGTAEMLDTEFPEVIQLKGPGNWWYTKSIIKGMEELQSHKDVDYALTLNDDIEIGPDYLQTIFNAAESISEPVVMGSLSVTSDTPSRITFSGTRKVIWWRSKQLYYHTSFQEVDLAETTGIHPSVVLPGRGMLIDTRILKEIGFFDERLVQYGSDDEFCLRAAKKGFKVFVCWDAVIYSHYKMTSGVTSYLRPSLKKLIKGYFNRYSRNYWFKDVYIHFHYGNKLAFPVTMGILLLGNLKSYLSSRNN